ncbi:MAG: dTMP kinase [Chitinivibrionales bacterium]|nr:dTMP kinase [Chitinivibrionales bacterium]
MRKGFFFAFEGIDGCGKSTQIAEIAGKLQNDVIPYHITREPGGTVIGEKIRSILLSPENNEMSIHCELLLYLASRAQHVQEKILPALQRGEIVVCDRFQDATFAYQGYGRAVPLDTLRNLNAFATGDLAPDCTFIFDLPVQEASARLKQTGKAPDRLEGNSGEFYEKIRKGYLDLAARDPDRYAVFSGMEPVHLLAGRVYEKIMQIMNTNDTLSREG